EIAEIPAKRFARLKGALRASFGLLVDVALPQLCPSCREPVGAAGLCPACWSRLSFIAPPYCERLGIPFPFDGGPGLLSMEAIADPPAYHRARAAVRYDEIARKLVHALKYGDRLDLAPIMGRWMARAGRELIADADALLPAPPASTCWYSRGLWREAALPYKAMTPHHDRDLHHPLLPVLPRSQAAALAQGRRVHRD